MWFPGGIAWRPLVVGLGLLVATVFLLESACYPWAYSVTFGPTLTGTWVGQFTPAIGREHAVLIELWADISDTRQGDDLAGKAWLCDGQTEPRDFGVTGDPRNWRGTRFRLRTYVTENRDGEGVQLASVDGEWDRRDHWDVTAALRLLRIRNGGVFTSSERTRDQVTLEDIPIRFALTRGTYRMFRETCDRLRATR